MNVAGWSVVRQSIAAGCRVVIDAGDPVHGAALLAVTMLAGHEREDLSETRVEMMCRRLGGTAVRWLAPARAAEFDIMSAPSEWHEIEAESAACGIDIVVQPKDGRRKSVLVSDMDSTVIGQECIDELAAVAGVGAEVASITTRAMRGELDFSSALEARVRLLADVPISVAEQVWRDRISLTPGARTLVRTMRAHGAHTVLISGGFTEFTRRVAQCVGFDEHHGNQLLARDGRLTGEVAHPPLGRSAKPEIMRAVVRRLGLSSDDVIAVGDGANDLDMLQAAGTGVAFHAKPLVARACSVKIAHADMTALLYLQGYAAGDFAAIS